MIERNWLHTPTEGDPNVHMDDPDYGGVQVRSGEFRAPSSVYRPNVHAMTLQDTFFTLRQKHERARDYFGWH